MIQYKIKLTVLLLLLLPAFGISQFRVVGYVPLGRQPVPFISDSTFKKLTHLNIAFINPDSAGNLIVPVGFDSLMLQAHASNIKVLMSIGGGTFNPNYANLLTSKNRESFIERLVTLCMNYNVDGIDVDIENDNIDKNYEGFVTDLSASLKPLHKLMTAALATWNAHLISDAALQQFDFINVMSYDETGPWSPDRPGPHAAYEKAAADIKYWTKSRRLAKEKINLGLPFYGYCFGTTYGESMAYKDIINTFPGAEQQDTIAPATGGNIYYNGLPTIQKKTMLALEKAGGVMIWQILQDTPGSKSLLSAIQETIAAGKKSKPESKINKKVRIKN
jgi:chitinase